jgi:hypothetical protein
MNEKTKIKTLIKLLDEAMQLAGEGWELADAYAGGESESADELDKKLDRLHCRIDKATK